MVRDDLAIKLPYDFTSTIDYANLSCVEKEKIGDDLAIAVVDN
jgi:hypothetical protein